MGKIFPPPKSGPKVLIYDIETAPIVAHVWKLWNNDVGLNQIQSDWHLLSWSAKWLGDPKSKIMYMDQRGKKKIEDDSQILKGIWKLLDKCDIVITQNGKAFDQKKLNARFIINNFQPPSTYKHIDTKVLAKKHFGFTSNRLEYMTDKICKKYKKLTNRKKFKGHDLWTECLKDNPEAWKEMEQYNKYDVLSLEELYKAMQPWDTAVNFNLYSDEIKEACNCGDNDWFKNGFHYTPSGRFQRYKCRSCGAEVRDKKNQFNKEKKKSLRVKT